MSIAVIEKAFMVLEAMAEFESSVPLKLLSDKTKLPKPTLYRILHSLDNLGYVTQEKNRGDYILTPKLAEVGSNRHHADLKRTALPKMEYLYTRFNETVNLGYLSGVNILYLHVLETTNHLRWIVQPGSQDPFYCTALGRAIVSQLPREAQEDLVSRTALERRTSSTPTEKNDLLKVLEKAKNNGWALDNEENEKGVVCLAVPLTKNSAPVAAISVSIPKSRLTSSLESEIVKALTELDKEL